MYSFIYTHDADCSPTHWTRLLLLLLFWQDEQIQALHKKIESLEKGKQFEADQTAVRAVQMETLTTLRSIREAVVSSSANGTSSAASTKEIEALKKENEALKVKNAKQNYRIKHLVRNLKKSQAS